MADKTSSIRQIGHKMKEELSCLLIEKIERHKMKLIHKWINQNIFTYHFYIIYFFTLCWKSFPQF